MRFSISVSFSPQPSSASNPSHKVRSSDSQRESEQHHFRLAPHGSSKVVWQFLAGSERSGGLRLLSPQRQRFLRAGRFRFISSLNILLNFSAFGVNPGLFIPASHASCFLPASLLLLFHLNLNQGVAFRAVFSISPLCITFPSFKFSTLFLVGRV